ncbi:hypothetical protein AV530_005222 [Patagioenas fasciata monilis]|uniref:Uncharacterized protein n=1 Tax=Patagioenas fasciata monilis TaxID=372326 RepID=A0A1V4JKI8_PATFA|nr:hypothetical protein AV530_005222 [Patagioenas fasciata monilis]
MVITEGELPDIWSPEDTEHRGETAQDTNGPYISQCNSLRPFEGIYITRLEPLQEKSREVFIYLLQKHFWDRTQYLDMDLKLSVIYSYKLNWG